MDSLNNYKQKLEKLDQLLRSVNVAHSRVRQLKRSVYVLRTLLKDKQSIQSPYGPATPIVRFSIQ